jgi:hypothetical protein
MVFPDRSSCLTVLPRSSIAICGIKRFRRLVLIYSGLIFMGCEGATLGRAIASTETVTVQSSSIASDSNPKTPANFPAAQATQQSPLLVYTKDTNRPEGTRTESFDIFIPNLKVGLTHNIDFQIIPEVYKIVQTRPKGGKAEETSGFGDLTLRMKVNLWGNDGGKTAFGIIPFVKLPTNQNQLGNNSVEGGIIFPLAIELSEKWDVGIMTEFDFNKNEADAGYNAGFVNSISFGYGINSQWSTYFELYTEVTTESGSQFIATFDTGLKYLVTENIQLDTGINIGLTQATEDLQPFVGISVRF